MTKGKQWHIIPFMEKMKEKIHFDYSPEKNLFLKEIRGISFEEVELAINEGRVLDITDHPNQDKYPNQKVYILDINSYIYLVPFVRKNEKEIFLKTIFPSRKAVKKYSKNKKYESKS